MELLPYLIAIFAGFILLWNFLKLMFPWLPEDLFYIRQTIKIFRKLGEYRKKNFTPSDKLAENAQKTPDRTAIVFEDTTWTYREIDNWTNQCARSLRKCGLRAGDKLGLMMMNEPAFITTWMGCMRLGVVVSFLNYNIRSKSLLHCIDISEVKILVIGKDDVLVEAIKKIEKELLDRDIVVFVHGHSAIQSSNMKSLNVLLDQELNDPCPITWKDSVEYNDPTCYIFTSGTTGLPKAVEVTNNKCWLSALLMNFVSPKKDDVIYTTLPLYHSAAAFIGVSGALLAGCTIVLRKKFSASQFWSDCRKYNVTIVQYIGEIIRYICMQPTTAEDRNHKVRAIVGNGLRPDVWRTFLDRYGSHIHVCEFYGATEGNVGFINFSNRFGCIGTLTPLLKKIGGAAIVKYDIEKGELIRDKNNRVVLADYNEPGLLLGKITKLTKISPYKGNSSLTEMKIVQNVFKEGDQYFNSGDLLIVDTNHQVYFCDRIGDTFRWKGENVSTNEVNETIATLPWINEVNTYGVQIPGTDGRAGMISIVLDLKSVQFDAKMLYKHVFDTLPSYARPIFVRIQTEMEVTGTFKYRKVGLQKEGFDLGKVGDDQIFFLDHQLKTYVPFTISIQTELEQGRLKL